MRKWSRPRRRKFPKRNVIAMTGLMENQDVYLSSFERLEKQRGSDGPSWVHRMRQAAMQRFLELGFPTTRLEEWKYTNVAPIARVPFQPAGDGLNRAITERLGRARFADFDCGRLVFVNGHYCGEFSSLPALPEGVKAQNLAAALEGRAMGLEEHLARHAGYEDHAFVALNTAFMEDGAWVQIPQDIALEKPIFLLFVSTANGQPTVSHPRNLILIGRESQVTLIEGYIGLGDGVSFTNAVTKIVAGDNAVIDHYKMQQESIQSFHVATLQVEQGRSSNVTSHSLALGGALVRNEINAVLAGEGAECQLNGLYVVTGQQHVDNHTLIDHAKPHCNSRELYKGILDGRAAGVFNGKIIVRKDAQKTDAKQSNKNLLLSENAVINTKPQLEIRADDVKCTHGATIGQLDPEALFYLRSRGIAREEARTLLTVAFAGDIIDRIKFESLRSRVKDAVLGRLTPGTRLEEA